MKSFILSCFILLSTFSAFANSQEDDVRLGLLVQRVDSLEHELSYFKLSYDLGSLNSDLVIFANEVYTKTIAIQLDLYNRNFNARLADSYKRYYESCEDKMQSYAQFMDAQKRFFRLKVLTYPYTESELSSLQARYNVINNAFETLQRSMELLELSIKEYCKYC